MLQCESLSKICDTVVDLYKNRLPKSYGENIKESLQVITPTKKTEAGTINLNKILQSVLNPPRPELKEKQHFDSVFRVGDKVMQVKNNYDIKWTRDKEEGEGVFNGDVGVIYDIDFSLELMLVKYDDRIAEYGFDLLEEIELAYAITVHKSQGSEFKVVILPVVSGLRQLCNRKLLYTAVTRAKEMLILVGSMGAVKDMIANDKYTRRYSGLKYTLMASSGM
jgi:exodeoxyribonuclease V alpha subunit